MKSSSDRGEKVPDGIQVFEKFHEQYDKWFTRNKWVYRSEVKAVRKLIPRSGLGFEVGVGTGRFSTPFEVEIGLDPSKKMGLIAKRRGINVVCGVGENLPFKGRVFDFVLNVTTICFVEDPFIVLKETRRVLRSGGSAVIGFVDRNSWLGRLYEAKKERSRFYKPAKFVSVDDVRRWLTRLNFADFSICQTIFHDLNEINGIEPIRKGYGKGGFVVFKAKKVENRGVA